MLGFLRPHLRASMVSLLLSCLAIVGTVAIPLLLGAVVDAIERRRPRRAPAAGARDRRRRHRCASRSSVPRRLIAGRVSLGVEYDLRNRIYRHLQSLELGFFDRQQTGQLMSRATVDLQSVRFFLGYGLIFILQNLLTILLAAVVMFVLQPSLAADHAGARAARDRWPRPATGATRGPRCRRCSSGSRELTAEAEESISGIRVVKAFARERRAPGALHGHRVGRVFDQSMFSTRLRAFYNPMISFLPNLGLAAVLLVGGRQVVNGSITLGEFVTFNTYLLMLMFPMRMLGHRARHGAARGRLGQPRVRDPRPRARSITAPARPAAAAAGRRRGSRFERRDALL